MSIELLNINNLQVKPTYWIDANKQVQLSGAFCVTDGKKNYGNVGSRYKPVSYNEILTFINNCLPSLKLQIVSHAQNKELSKGILTLDTGNSTTIQLPGLNTGENIKLYINLVNSLNGSTPVGILVTPLRPSCMNQYWLIKRSAFIHLNYRHTAHGLTLMKSHASLFQEIIDLFNEQLRNTKTLAQRNIDDAHGQAIIQQLVKEKVINDRTANAALAHWSAPKQPEDAPRNEWVLFNCVTKPINTYLNLKNRWSSIKELEGISKFFSKRI